MLTIETKYIGPSNTRGSRVSAKTTNSKPTTGKPERLTLSYDHGLDSIGAHLKAAQALAQREEWPGIWTLVGETERGYLFARPQMMREDLTFTIEDRRA